MRLFPSLSPFTRFPFYQRGKNALGYKSIKECFRKQKGYFGRRNYKNKLVMFVKLWCKSITVHNLFPKSLKLNQHKVLNIHLKCLKETRTAVIKCLFKNINPRTCKCQSVGKAWVTCSSHLFVPLATATGVEVFGYADAGRFPPSPGSSSPASESGVVTALFSNPKTSQTAWGNSYKDIFNIGCAVL